MIIHWTCANNNNDDRLTLTERVWAMNVRSGYSRSVDHSFAVWSNEQLANNGAAGLQNVTHATAGLQNVTHTTVELQNVTHTTELQYVP